MIATAVVASTVVLVTLCPGDVHATGLKIERHVADGIVLRIVEVTDAAAGLLGSIGTELPQPDQLLTTAPTAAVPQQPAGTERRSCRRLFHRKVGYLVMLPTALADR